MNYFVRVSSLRPSPRPHRTDERRLQAQERALKAKQKARAEAAKRRRRSGGGGGSRGRRSDASGSSDGRPAVEDLLADDDRVEASLTLQFAAATRDRELAARQAEFDDDELLQGFDEPGKHSGPTDGRQAPTARANAMGHAVRHAGSSSTLVSDDMSSIQRFQGNASADANTTLSFATASVAPPPATLEGLAARLPRRPRRMREVAAGG